VIMTRILLFIGGQIFLPAPGCAQSVSLPEPPQVRAKDHVVSLTLHAVNENGRDVGEPAPSPFRYFDKGNLAVVGKGFAVLQSGKIHVKGFPAWLAWAAVHLQFLAQSNLRVSVLVQWVWTYLTGQRGSRLIVNYHGSETQRPMADAPQKAVVSSE